MSADTPAASSPAVAALLADTQPADTQPAQPATPASAGRGRAITAAVLAGVVAALC